MRSYVHANSCVGTWLQGRSTAERYPEEGPLDSEVGGHNHNSIYPAGDDTIGRSDREPRLMVPDDC